MLSPFNDTQPHRFNAAVVICDLEGFTDFCTKVGAELRIPSFLNITLELVSSCLDSGRIEGQEYDFFLERKAEHIKFLGDGCLVIWRLPNSEEDQMSVFEQLINGSYIARKTFPSRAEDFRGQYGLPEVPKQLRFGIAMGEILELIPQRGSKEYAGYPINLASRLQGYSKHLGFIVSARAGVKSEKIDEMGLIQVTANNVRGFGREMVLVDAIDFANLPSAEAGLFSTEE